MKAGANIEADEMLAAYRDRGDLEAFARLLILARQVVSTACVRSCARQDVDDISQKIFLTCAAGDRFRFANWRDFKAYVYRAAYNAAIDIVRRDRRTQTLDEEAEQIVARDDSLDIPNLLEYLDKLPPKYRVCLLLYSMDFDYAQIARVTGLSSTQVRGNLNRGKGELRKLLSPK